MNDISLLLYRNRLLIGSILLIGLMLNCVLRFWGQWHQFASVLLVQLWFGQAVFSYLIGERVSIGPSGFEKEDDPTGRAVLAGFSFVVYVLAFFVPF
ncbi:hypothetical protein [Pseudomonas sp. 5P_3.1_Bac2]|uniref:hypothetical protein n=1 Tax=Pseudomonas sp. 5P_3.1_Bac2 TaxID=2971617 RepID=UPI0021C9016F|nr:hypothetical protein [Pseudomonas sp. 5P_3.1_Bac2]MCU1718751.1 hypothetical protein [Pseudomonas sp. 5P_3.1_Bac2]